MQVRQVVLNQVEFEAAALQELAALQPQWVVVFASISHFEHPAFAETLRAAFPQAQLTGCSTAGEISGDGVGDRQAVVTAVKFDHAGVQVATTELADMPDSHAAGARLAGQLAAPGLHNIVVFGQGVNINGSALIEGIAEVAGPQVVISGGLAGDAGKFSRSYTLSNAGVSASALVAIGFSDPALKLSHGSFGGWQPFGPARKVTRCAGNVLYELDGEKALDIYKHYLGDYAKDLPASGLLFPFAMLGEDHQALGLIRTILGINEADGSLILAGDIVESGYMKLMHASTDALVDGAQAAAEAAGKAFDQQGDTLALLVSCIGRKLVMGARVDEEVEAVGDVFGSRCTLAGFYSNGEISPFLTTTECKLHNQTMTITTLAEV